MIKLIAARTLVLVKKKMEPCPPSITEALDMAIDALKASSKIEDMTLIDEPTDDYNRGWNDCVKYVQELTR